jgi:predicted HicB family RNase H-like nuclease
MNTMHHEDYVARIELDEDVGLFHGEVINTRDVLTFQGRTLDELRAAFADTITDHVSWCRERGEGTRAALLRKLSAAAAARPTPSHRHGRRPRRQERQCLCGGDARPGGVMRRLLVRLSQKCSVLRQFELTKPNHWANELFRHPNTLLGNPLHHHKIVDQPT